MVELALVLRRFDFGETSQTGRLFARERGRISVLAKGIKRAQPELRGPMDLFALAEVEILERPKSELHLLTRYRVVTGFPGLRLARHRLNAAYWVTEILREGTRDGDPAPELFDLALETLAGLEVATLSGASLLLSAFDLGFLSFAGFAPNLERCTTCRREAPDRGPVRYAPYHGGLVCRDCLTKRPVRVLTLSKALRDLIAKLREPLPLERLQASEVPEELRGPLRSLLTGILQHTLERELRCAAVASF